MGKLISNQETLLKEVIKNILPKSDKLYFLVGYFYFSGIQSIYEELKDKNLKILVGMDIEKDLNNKIREFEILDHMERSRLLIKEDFFKNFIEFFNDTDYFDNEEKLEAFKLFLDKIDNGTLIIKKTVKPTHAKMYIFENKAENNEGGEYPGPIIIGSSNLSYSGLENRIEINTILRDKNDFNEAKRIFDELWESAIEIATPENKKEFFTKVIDKIWYEKYPSPYILFVRVLLEYFSEESIKQVKLPSEITNKKYFNLEYQTHAIKSGIKTINKHSGVLIADVVGLGKSIIASAIAYNLQLKTIIITPPHLKSQWENYSWEFNLVNKIYSSGKLEEAYKENDDDEEKVIIIDEAHKYRNEMTKDYATLHKLCQGNKIILLTATPFNNRPQDLFALIKLFQIPAKSTIRTVENLWFRFKELIREYREIKKLRQNKKSKKEDIKNKIEKYADEIRDLISPFIIRRSRIDLLEIEDFKKDLEKQKIRFPEVQPPEILDYDLGEISNLYVETLNKISPDDDFEHDKGFIGARYKPVTYLKDFKKYKNKIRKEFGSEELFKQAQVNLAKFMRRLLVRRFESSVKAFEKSLDSMINSTQNMIEWYDKAEKIPIYKKGKLPTPEELLEITDEDLKDLKIDEIIERETNEKLQQFIEKGLIFIDKKEIKKQFREDLEKDINLLKEIKKRWFMENEETVYSDPKFKSFKEVLKKKLEENPKRKIVVFTEFADTSNYLFNNLENKGFKVLEYTSSISSKEKKQTLLKNFDANLSETEQKNDYDILVATDAISEGVNLNRAGIVFNYDIPYNPTRVIQRVGRINRINKLVFEKLYIYNFFPTIKGESEIGIKKITTLKISLIHALLGGDTQYLTNEEEIKSYFKEQYEQSMKIHEERSWEVDYYNTLSKIKKNDELIKKALSVPKRVKIKRSVKKEKNGVLIFGKKGDDYVFKLGISNDEIIPLTAKQAFRLFESEESESPEKPDESFEPIYQQLKKTLFVSKKEIKKDKGLSTAIKKIDVLIEKKPEDSNYFKELKFIIEKLGALPEKYLKQIRDINSETLAEDIEQLKKDIPFSYIGKIRKKIEKLDAAKESIIISEQLI